MWEGTRLIGETFNNVTLLALYDSDGSVCGILYNGVAYYFNKNLQGDVISIIDMEGTTVAKYTYDAWGKILSITDAQGNLIGDESNIALVNPFRYRGYYYDTESALYYLQTRYYDPETGRFISPDNTAYLDPESFTGLNLYAYCGNDPVMFADPSGCFVFSTFLICIAIGTLIGGTFGGITAYQNGQNIGLGILTGASLGAVAGAIAGLGGTYLAGGISTMAGKFISDATSSLIYATNNFGTWEDYTVAFMSGGLLKGLPINSLAKPLARTLKFSADVFARPAINQIVKMGTRGAEFDTQKYSYNVIARACTYDITILTFVTNLFGYDISVGFGKAILRGLLSGWGKKYVFN